MECEIEETLLRKNELLSVIDDV